MSLKSIWKQRVITQLLVHEHRKQFTVGNAKAHKWVRSMWSNILEILTDYEPHELKLCDVIYSRLSLVQGTSRSRTPNQPVCEACEEAYRHMVESRTITL